MIEALRKACCSVVACVLLVAPVGPQVCAADCDHGCDLGCCQTEVGGCCSACPEEASEPPCHCQFEARQDQPLSVHRGASPDHDHAGRATAVAATLPDAPRLVGVSREYVAASLAVPIRPVRILFGVWRN